MARIEPFLDLFSLKSVAAASVWINLECRLVMSNFERRGR